jgi:FolB domain-containing protein
MQRIIIDSLKVKCIVGVKPEERQTPQEVSINLKLVLDLTNAISSDDIEDTVDYDDLTRQVVRFVEQSDFKLLEKLAYEVASLAKEQTRAAEVTVLVKKPAAIKNARYAAAECVL